MGDPRRSWGSSYFMKTVQANLILRDSSFFYCLPLGLCYLFRDSSYSNVMWSISHLAGFFGNDDDSDDSDNE